MNKTLTTLAAGALALALIVPAYAGTSAPAPSSTSSVAHAKSHVGKVIMKKGKHGKKAANRKQHKAAAPVTTPAPAPAPVTH